MNQLFGQIGFTDYVNEHKKSLAKFIKNVDDSKLISYRDNIEELAKMACKGFYMNCDVELNFNVKKADVVKLPVKPGTEKRLVQYSIPIKGNIHYLTINPFNYNDTRQMSVKYVIKDGNFQFLIDTNYYGDLTDKQVAMAKATSMVIENYINDGLTTLRNKAAEFNALIEKEVAEYLNSLLPAAIKRQDAIDKLNS